MTALMKHKSAAKTPVRPGDREPSAREMFERAKDRYPETMKRLAE